MRARKPSLDDVVAEFEEWRSKPHERLIPERLWRSAIALADRHAPSAIAKRLRLSPARFKEKRAALGTEVVRAAPRGRRRRRAGGDKDAESRGRVSASVFAEIVPVPEGSVIGRTGTPSVGGYRLVLESARGTIAVSAPTGDRGLVEAMWQVMSGVLRGVIA
jgi:hypothetical protein